MRIVIRFLYLNEEKTGVVGISLSNRRENKMFHLLLAIIYISFISLGLPDGLLGAAWPSMAPELCAPISYAGLVAMIISIGTISSSLLSERLTFYLGTGKVTAISVAMTAAALWGFSSCDSFWQLCIWAIPYGFGAGSVDAGLNNYVALHYTSRHMSWLHCMWGVGATVGPYIMGLVLTNGGHWTLGYRSVGAIQIILSLCLFFSLPLWKERKQEMDKNQKDAKPLSLKEIFRIPGAKEVMVAFFCYCAIEQTAGLWASSYLNLHKGVAPETAAFFASMFFIGITVGRAMNGFLTIKFSDTQLIRIGMSIVLVGIAVMLLPMGEIMSIVGLILIGLGCAPVYPCVIHSTPHHFGEDKSQAIIGVQMASAYVGTCLMPPLFGVIANHISVSLMPVYLLAILILMAVMHEKMLKAVGK